MKPFQTVEEGPDGEKTDTKLADGRVSTIVQLKEWTDSAIICWGGLRLGGRTTVHLVSALEMYGATMGGLAACMPKWGANVIWTFEFGFKNWEGAVLCKNCFEVAEGGKVFKGPKAKKMPNGGWFTYGMKPDLELKKKNAAVVQALLSIPPLQADILDRQLLSNLPDGTKRIVEI